MNKILVVDDEEAHRKAIAQVLTLTGYDVLAAKSGAEALEQLSKGEIGLILLDIIMPGLHGLDVLSKIKEDYKETIVVMLASQREQMLLTRAMQLGAFDFVMKPVEKEELLQVVKKAFAVHDLSANGHKKFMQLKALETGALKLADLKGQDVTVETLFDSKAFLQTTMNLIADVLEVEKVSLMIVDERRKELRLISASGFDLTGIETDRRKVGEGIAGKVAETGEPLLVKDIKKDSRFAESKRPSRYKTDSFLCVPLKMKGRVVGVISANDKKTGESFDENDLSLLLTFSQQIALTIENAVMGRDLKRYAEKLSLLTEINRTIVAEAEPKKIYQDVTQLGQKVLDAEACALFLLEEGTENFVCQGGTSELGPLGEGARIVKGDGVLGSVAKDGALASFDNVESDPRYRPDVDCLGGIKPRSFLVAPVHLKDRILGILVAVNKKGDRGFSPRDIEIMDSLSLSTSIALKNAWLHDNLVKTLDDMAKMEMELEKVKAQGR